VSPASEQTAETSTPDLALARLSFAFLLDQMTNGMAGLEPLDALLVLAINQANIAPLTRDPQARARYGQLDAPAPDDERRPVSINAVAASLGLPFETARRRTRRLAGEGVCVVTPEGVVVPASFLASPPYLHSVLASHERLRGFYLELVASGRAEDLPESAYALEPEVPIRAAARLLADYLLRSSEGLLREAGNVVSGLILVALLSAALNREEALTHGAIVRRLRLPAETVRRHAAQMAGRGLCARTPGRLVMTPEILAKPGLQLLLADNATHVQRLLAGLAERGVILAWHSPAAAGVKLGAA
jgi:hypothetical protein